MKQRNRAAWGRMPASHNRRQRGRMIRCGGNGSHSGEWSSLVARRAHNPEVAGANPVSPTEGVSAADARRKFESAAEDAGKDGQAAPQGLAEAPPATTKEQPC